MPSNQDRIEVERVTNLVQGFGWSVPKQEITDTEIIIEMRKPRTDSGETPPVGPG